ncbi:hypothetical protein [Cryptosporangium phraense]|uniref:Uncharacterized protein n=1 Tax=Cryptosporangium phraense TaxID=2593070 RepID=A0A545AW38_9ACTN|nr:hypothetical protein [Cryptosporangium phraense]TQS45527.1 hypothetical protein FL583_07250 [Cryptosporangium phraense]
MGTSKDASPALATEVPTLAEPVLFEIDAPRTMPMPALPPVLPEDPPVAIDLPPHEMPGTQPLPFELPDAPFAGSAHSADDDEPDIDGLASLRSHLRAALVSERIAGASVRRTASHAASRPVPVALPPAPRGPALGGPELRNPVTGLVLAIALGLLALFFASVSATPFWLATGVGSTGTATVLRCQERTLGDTCTARFTPADHAFAQDVRLANVSAAQLRPGTPVPARLLHRDSTVAYAGPAGDLHLRWVLGFLLVLACGVGIGAATGVPRLRREGPQRVAALWILSLLGPVLLLAASLVIALF